MTIIETAINYASSGLSVIPIRADQSKGPSCNEWKSFMDIAMSETEIQRNFVDGQTGVAIIGGKISGNLTIVDFDDAATFAKWAELIEIDRGHDFFSRLVIVQTPRPGFHVYVRSTQCGGNDKLARMLLPGEKPILKTLIETKSEGGYVLAPGCPAACHETGRTYNLIQGSLKSIPQVTSEELEAILSTARSLNCYWKEAAPEIVAPPRCNDDAPGIDFCKRATWESILLPHGFKPDSRRGDVQFWTRPGKSGGVSASTNHAGSGLLYLFSSNCYPFESDRGYNKYSVYGLLNHGGDFRAAAKELARSGYGNMELKQQITNPLDVSAIIDINGLLPLIESLYITGLEKGKSTGWSSLDEFWTVRKKELTVVTGYPNHGKSCWLDNLMVGLAKREMWRFGVFSAENLPLQRYAASLLEIYLGKPFSMGPTPRLTVAELRSGAEWLQDHFRFMNPDLEHRDIDYLLSLADVMVKRDYVDCIVIDPWNELNNARTKDQREDEFIGMCLSKMREFARTRDVHFFIVAHPSKLPRDRDGKHPVPSLFDVSGAAHWNSKSDNGLCVWRDITAPDEPTKIYIQKVRFREVGRAGGCADLKYNVVTGQYTDPNHKMSADEMMAAQNKLRQEPWQGQF